MLSVVSALKAEPLLLVRLLKAVLGRGVLFAVSLRCLSGDAFENREE